MIMMRCLKNYQVAYTFGELLFIFWPFSLSTGLSPINGLHYFQTIAAASQIAFIYIAQIARVKKERQLRRDDESEINDKIVVFVQRSFKVCLAYL